MKLELAIHDATENALRNQEEMLKATYSMHKDVASLQTGLQEAKVINHPHVAN